MMIDIIWHLRGSVSFNPAVDDQAIIDTLKDFLAKQRKTVVAHGADHLKFYAPVWSSFFGSNRSAALLLFDKGEFEITHDVSGPKIHFDLRSLHSMIFCLFAGASFFIVSTSNGASLGFGVTAAAVAFVWLYGMNLLVAVMRVPAALRKAVRSTDR